MTDRAVGERDRPLSGPTSSPVPVPRALRVLVGSASAPGVWRNELGGLTFRVGEGVDALYVKWSPRASGLDVRSEVDRLTWARRWWRVPEVVEVGEDGDGAWFVSRALPGENAASLRWRADPATAVRAVGEGLRAMHDCLDVDICPFTWSRDERLRQARRRAAVGELDDAVFDFEFAGSRLDEVLAELDTTPDDDLVVCHGDACVPNTLIADDGHWSAHVDFGRLGVADRWADLAVAAWSTVWNYGPHWEDALYDAYGREPDLGKIRYYRLLWSVG